MHHVASVCGVILLVNMTSYSEEEHFFPITQKLKEKYENTPVGMRRRCHACKKSRSDGSHMTEILWCQEMAHIFCAICLSELGLGEMQKKLKSPSMLIMKPMVFIAGMAAYKLTMKRKEDLFFLFGVCIKRIIPMKLNTIKALI